MARDRSQFGSLEVQENRRHLTRPRHQPKTDRRGPRDVDAEPDTVPERSRNSLRASSGDTLRAQILSMNIERASSENSLMDVLDRVLDKGVVIDAWVRLSLRAIDLVTMKTQVVIASTEAYLHHSFGSADLKSTAMPRGEGSRRISFAESIGRAEDAAVLITAHERFPPPRTSPSHVQVRPRMNT